MADVQSQARFPEFLSTAKDGHLSYPLVAINGQLKLAGSAHYYHVLPLVEQVLGVEDTAQ